MNHDLVIKNISKHISLDANETKHLISLLKPKHVSRKELILKEGDLCRYINFVHSGTLRAYYFDRMGKESTIMFAVSDWWVTDMFCFINQHPAMLTIEAVEESFILQLHKEDYDQLFMSIPKFEKFFRVLMQNAYIREQLRVIENLSLSAADRYHNFLTKYPQVAKQVTQKQIASYLGITPEFLSQIRGARTKKEIS